MRTVAPKSEVITIDSNALFGRLTHSFRSFNVVSIWVFWARWPNSIPSDRIARGVLTVWEVAHSCTSGLQGASEGPTQTWWCLRSGIKMVSMSSAQPGPASWPRKGYVYFMGTSEGKWLGRHLFKASLKEGPSQKVQQITKEAGMHGVVVDKHLGQIYEILAAKVWVGLILYRPRYIHKIHKVS